LGSRLRGHQAVPSAWARPLDAVFPFNVLQGIGEHSICIQRFRLEALLASRRPVQPRPDPRRRLVLAHLEHAAGRLDLGLDAPPGDKGTGNVEIGGPGTADSRVSNRPFPDIRLGTYEIEVSAPPRNGVF